MPDVYTISQVTAYIRQLLEESDFLQDVWLEGEISNLTVATSGHWYFTLKDSEAQIACVMWKSTAARYRNTPQNGTKIQVHGKISIYPQKGGYQLYVDMLRVAGMGDLYAEFEQLKQRLQYEGLFDNAYKKPLPPVPQRIGVVTSADAAAFQDIQNVLRRRFPLAELILSPCLVQGKDAPAQIVRALQLLDAHGQTDVILLIRGGGSIEDLWAFNDEQVARAIFDAQTPIISGVGHETDFTIADFVADYRAPTPSAAAEVATPDLAQAQLALQSDRQRLRQAFNAHLQDQREQLGSVRKLLSYHSPSAFIRNARQQTDELHTRLQRRFSSYIERARERLLTRRAALEVASPLAILARGYAIVSRADGSLLRAAPDAKPHETLHIQLADGTVTVTVKGTEDANSPQQPTLF